MWRRPKFYVTDLRDGSGRAVNRGDVHTFYVTDHLRDGLRNHSTTTTTLVLITAAVSPLSAELSCDLS